MRRWQERRRIDLNFFHVVKFENFDEWVVYEIFSDFIIYLEAFNNQLKQQPSTKLLEKQKNYLKICIIDFDRKKKS